MAKSFFLGGDKKSCVILFYKSIVIKIRCEAVKKSIDWEKKDKKKKIIKILIIKRANLPTRTEEEYQGYEIY